MGGCPNLRALTYFDGPIDPCPTMLLQAHTVGPRPFAETKSSHSTAANDKNNNTSIRQAVIITALRLKRSHAILL